MVTDLENDAISLYGQFDWHLNDRLTATVGLNYTKDEKIGSVRATRSEPFSGVSLENLGFAQMVEIGNINKKGRSESHAFQSCCRIFNYLRGGIVGEVHISYFQILQFFHNSNIIKDSQGGK